MSTFRVGRERCRHRNTDCTQEPTRIRGPTSGPSDRAAEIDLDHASPAAEACLSARAAALVCSPDMSFESDYSPEKKKGKEPDERRSVGGASETKQEGPVMCDCVIV